MVGLFAFDGPLYCDVNGVYCNTTITNEMLNRYYEVVDKLIVVIRTIHLNETYTEKHLRVLETGSNMSIIEIPNLNSPINFISRGQYQKLIATCVEKSDLFFLRRPSIISNMVASECLKQNKKY